MDDATRTQARKLAEEKAKLSAGWMNNVAAAVFAIGTLQPIVAGTVSRWSLILFGAAFVIHLFAHNLLDRQFPRS
jgi:hypothetical protein